MKMSYSEATCQTTGSQPATSPLRKYVRSACSNACKDAVCGADRLAKCEVDVCGESCKPTWRRDGAEVDCDGNVKIKFIIF